MEQTAAEDTGSAPSVAPVLSTPASHMFEDPTPTPDPSMLKAVDEEELYNTYEVLRTVQEIHQRGFGRVALQFPDGLLPHAVPIYQALQRELQALSKHSSTANQKIKGAALETNLSNLSVRDSDSVKLFILADTSYSSCCADEVAAEHVSADVIVHYGRACLSPTAHLPVIHIFTKQTLQVDAAASAFASTFPKESDPKVILAADLPYNTHLPDLLERLVLRGYNKTNIFISSPIHAPNAPIPNRTSPPGVESSIEGYSVFHVGTPPTALILALSSRISSPNILSIYDPSSSTSTSPLENTRRLLRRRYATVSRIRAFSIIGILTAAPSSKAMLPTVSLLTQRIRAAGKKSYLVSVGKLNPAKLANFSEIEMWAVAGCWESSLVEESKSGEFFAPMVTAWEALTALEPEGMQRIYRGEWEGEVDADAVVHSEQRKDESDEEPVYDFRTGRLVTNSRPMRTISSKKGTENAKKDALIKRSDENQLATIGGVVSPAAEFLREKRTWQGLGSDFEVDYTDAGVVVQEGRSGVARGYANEKNDDNHVN